MKYKKGTLNSRNIKVDNQWGGLGLAIGMLAVIPEQLEANTTEPKSTPSK